MNSLEKEDDLEAALEEKKNSQNEPLCSLCLRGKRLTEVRSDCFKRQKKAAEKMVNITEEQFPPLTVGDIVTVIIPPEDRGPLDLPNIFGIIMHIENGVYQIGTQDCLINGWFPRTSIQKSNCKYIDASEVPKEKLSLREAAAKQSLSGGQGYKKCQCKSLKNQCQTNKCKCFKAGILCNSRCHSSSSCCNK